MKDTLPNTSYRPSGWIGSVLLTGLPPRPLEEEPMGLAQGC